MLFRVKYQIGLWFYDAYHTIGHDGGILSLQAIILWYQIDVDSKIAKRAILER